MIATTNLHSAAEAGAADAGCWALGVEPWKHRSTTALDASISEPSSEGSSEASIKNDVRNSDNQRVDPGIGADRPVWCWPKPDGTSNLIRSRGPNFYGIQSMPERRQYKLKRLTIDITDDEHRVLKSLAAEAGITMRRLVIRTLRREGLLTRPMQGVRYLLGS
jgi:hypothetical protein